MNELWEQQAGWWQRGFTAGADPEYEEQIIPLAVEFLAGRRHVLDVGCGEGQIARLVRADRVIGVGQSLYGPPFSAAEKCSDREGNDERKRKESDQAAREFHL